eukprot:1482920-Alexandrium_andersonii.AAC.1
MPPSTASELGSRGPAGDPEHARLLGARRAASAGTRHGARGAWVRGVGRASQRTGTGACA